MYELGFIDVEDDYGNGNHVYASKRKRAVNLIVQEKE